MSDGAPKVVRVDANALTGFTAGILEHAGVPGAQATLWAESLVWANLRGIDSHGVLRVPRYLELITSGEINPRPEMKTLVQQGAVALLDADRAPGPVGMGRAVELAIERAREAHVGWCSARGITHAGAIGALTLQISEAGLVGIVMTASRPLMAYHGSRDPVLSTNPIAIAVPASRRDPLVLDMSTATVALGKIMSARRTGEPLGEGWALDQNGAPTTDPEAAATLTPMAGPKGSGLSLMIECLASLVAGNPVISAALGGATGSNMNGAVIALDPGAFGPMEGFLDNVDALVDAVHAQATGDRTDRLLMPGERGRIEKAAREKNGIPLPPKVWSDLLTAAERANVPPPELMGAS